MSALFFEMLPPDRLREPEEGLRAAICALIQYRGKCSCRRAQTLIDEQKVAVGFLPRSVSLIAWAKARLAPSLEVEIFTQDGQEWFGVGPNFDPSASEGSSLLNFLEHSVPHSAEQGESGLKE